MRTLKIVSSNVEPVTFRPSVVGRYYLGEVNRCPACGGKAWEVGRLYAECSSQRLKYRDGVFVNGERCGYALAIVTDH